MKNYDSYISLDGKTFNISATIIILTYIQKNAIAMILTYFW